MSEWREAGTGPTQDVPTDHDYDGIREFDNPLPGWWLTTFYGTVIFAVGYWFFYHSLGAGDLPMNAYANELAVAAAEEDARLAVESGADALIVSNHGGRQLDGAPSSIAALPQIAQAVGPMIEVWMDGGIRSGQDVLKAVALGAKGTLIGRSFLILSHKFRYLFFKGNVINPFRKYEVGVMIGEVTPTFS